MLLACCRLLALLILATPALALTAEQPSQLRLVPFPREVQITSGEFSLRGPLVLEGPPQQLPLVAEVLSAEFRRAGVPAAEAKPLPGGTSQIRLGPPHAQHAVTVPTLPARRSDEGYILAVTPSGTLIDSRTPSGLLNGVQTLAQLVRANRKGGGIPCLTIRDWPALRWRCFQNDMTRGPSAKLSTLEEQVRVGAGLKMNLFTYYMEYQYAWSKHPEIGPPDGSLTPEELRRLVAYAKPYGVDILGNQQSFGHWSRILKLEKYAHLKENDAVLSPVHEGTYQLLDDLYREVCPLLPFGMFNVCCDETWGLGTGPSKAMAEKIGVGGVYVGHLCRVHDLLQKNYQKRMMMWGDIILHHPEHLAKIPKDTVMLTWGYGPAKSFEHQIIPFAQSGYEFFVCPGTSDWSRILPDFDVATTNIRTFVRDGVKHGATGMLNTTWKDDGESLNAPNWHGWAWGAECAWTGAITEPADFNRRLGAVLFGEKGDHFGQAIELLQQTHRMAAMQGMNNKRFWDNDFLLHRRPESMKAAAEKLLALVRPAIKHLETCRAEASANAELLDAFVLGARRMERIGQRSLDALEAARRYAAAYDRSLAGSPDSRSAIAADLECARRLVSENRAAHAALFKEFRRLWLEENKLYALDWTARRYEGLDQWYSALLAKLDAAKEAWEKGKPLASPDDVGLSPAGSYARRTRPHAIVQTPLAGGEKWQETAATHRMAIVVEAGKTARRELPIELELQLPAAVRGCSVRAFCGMGAGPSREVAAQLDRGSGTESVRLAAILPGPLAAGGKATVWLYLGIPRTAEAPPAAASTKDAPQGMKWIENDQLRLLLGPEGGHLYRVEVKALGNRDITQPGERGWAGFSDIGNGHRDTPHRLTCVARGPALVRYECCDPLGLMKSVSLYAGTSWFEVVLADPVERYWEFDATKNFAADGPTPGEYLFSNGKTGKVGKATEGVQAQVKAMAWWSAKHNRELLLGLVTPESAARHVIAPGSGAGGVGIEASTPAGHFVTYAGRSEEPPKAVMERLRTTLDFRNQPRVTVYGVEERSSR